MYTRSGRTQGWYIVYLIYSVSTCIQGLVGHKAGIYSVSTCIQGLVGHKAGIYSVPYI